MKNKDVPDRLITCTRCNKWTTKDSTRHNTTSNMLRHLEASYKVFPPNRPR